MTETYNLLPCPFCGETDIEGPHPLYHKSGGQAWVECNNTKCEAYLCQTAATPELAITAVVGAWNKRVIKVDKTNEWRPCPGCGSPFMRNHFGDCKIATGLTAKPSLEGDHNG